MVKKWTKWIVLAIFLLILGYLWLEIETDLPYNKPAIQPVRVDWRVFEVDIPVNGSKFTVPQSGTLIATSMEFKNGLPTGRSIVKMLVPPSYNITSISFNIPDLFSENATGALETNPHLGNYFDDFVYINNVLWVQQNTTRLNEYKSQNPPDIILTSPSFIKGNFSTWVVVWTYFSTLNRFSIPTISLCNKHHLILGKPPISLTPIKGITLAKILPMKPLTLSR